MCDVINNDAAQFKPDSFFIKQPIVAGDRRDAAEFKQLVKSQRYRVPYPARPEKIR
jgi:hypothetical protein